MAFGTQDETDDVMNEINMTPLVDVMLVLLIIFIITVPVMKHSVNIDLPRATNQPQDTKPQTIRLSVDADGNYWWNESRVSDADLPRLLRAEAAREPQPELHLRGCENATRAGRCSSPAKAASRPPARQSHRFVGSGCACPQNPAR